FVYAPGVLHVPGMIVAMGVEGRWTKFTAIDLKRNRHVPASHVEPRAQCASRILRAKSKMRIEQLADCGCLPADVGNRNAGRIRGRYRITRSAALATTRVKRPLELISGAECMRA